MHLGPAHLSTVPDCCILKRFGEQTVGEAQHCQKKTFVRTIYFWASIICYKNIRSWPYLLAFCLSSGLACLLRLKKPNPWGLDYFLESTNKNDILPIKKVARKRTAEKDLSSLRIARHGVIHPHKTVSKA